nr:copia protein [Tanacetum cinerariifolium]
MNMTIIGTKWVFRNKLDENGIVSQNKARLVSQGYNQQDDIDYVETYALVARLESIRILLAYACALDFKLFQMDIRSAFLNGFINEEVYVAQSPEFIDFEKQDRVYKLKKALYGLKQTPKAPRDSNAGSSSTTLNHPSSSHPLDDIVDVNDEESFRSNYSSPSQNVSSSSNVVSRVLQIPPHESQHLNTYLSETIDLQTQHRDDHRKRLRSIGKKLLEDLQIIKKELIECNRPIFFDNNKDHSVQYKEYLKNSFKEIAALNFNQEKEEPPQDSDIRQLIREEWCIEVCEEQKKNIEDMILELIEIYRQKELFCMHDNVDDLIESALKRLDKKKQEVKNVVEQPAERRNRIIESLHNFRVIHKSSISLNSTSQISPVHAVAPILSTKEPEYSPSMGYVHPNTTPETKSDEIIKSGVEELIPILSENEVTSEDKRECDVPVCENSPICDDHSEIYFDSNNDDDISSDDDAFEKIEYVEASLPDPEIVSVEEANDVHQEEEEVDLEDISQIQDVILREKLLSINRLIANIESLNDNPTPHRLLNSSASIPIFKKSDDSLSDNFSPEFETFCDHTEEMRSGNTTTHADDSLPEYDSFCFEIEPDQERLINVGIENFGDDSERDICFLEGLLIYDSIPFLVNEASDFDSPSVPRPPSEPQNADFEPEVMNDNDELECLDPKDEIDEDDDYFPFMFVIRIFLPDLIYSKVFSILLSTESEDTIFDPGIFV